MELSIQEVEHIAALARLKLTAEEKERYRKQLSAVLENFARLQKVDTSQIAPTSSLFASRSALRPDVPEPGLSPEQLLRNAEEAEHGQFRVPPVFE